MDLAHPLLDLFFRSPYYNCYVGLDLGSGSWKIQSHQVPSQFICWKVMKAKVQTWKTYITLIFFLQYTFTTTKVTWLIPADHLSDHLYKVGISTEAKNPTFSSSPCARDACRSGIAPRKLTLQKWTTRQKPQWRPEGITIPKGDFLLLRVSLKTMFKALLVFCVWSILRSKRFKSFSFGQELVCAESRHAAAGTTTTTMTAVSFLRVSKHLDGRLGGNGQDDWVSAKRFQLPKKEELQVSVENSDHFLGVMIFFNSSALLSSERKELFNSIFTTVDSTHLPARRIISCFWNVNPPQFLLNWCLGCERWVFFNVPLHIFHRYPAFKLFQTATQILRAAAERARSLGHLFGFHGKTAKSSSKKERCPPKVLKSPILGIKQCISVWEFWGDSLVFESILGGFDGFLTVCANCSF